MSNVKLLDLSLVCLWCVCGGMGKVRETLIARMGALYPRSQRDPNAALAPETTAEAFATPSSDLSLGPMNSGAAVYAGSGAARMAPGSSGVGSLLIRRDGGDAKEDVRVTHY